MNTKLKEIQGKLGFGCMRLPLQGEEVELAQFSQMVDSFLAGGFNYFDTAHGYLKGQSELALGAALGRRHPREDYILTNKLSPWLFKQAEDIRPLFTSQLKACAVDYFDYYLMHAQNEEYNQKCKDCRAYEIVAELKNEGKIRHLGISFHDKAAVLDQILSEHPSIEVVQIQFNYLDYDDLEVESLKCYEVCLQHNKDIIIMEPVKGGSLVNLPPQAREILEQLSIASPAEYALRYAASFPGVVMVLSGMSNLSQLKENIAFMSNFKALSPAELAAATQLRPLIRQQELIPCTACRYCVEGCPQHIDIPELFACLNSKKLEQNQASMAQYQQITARTAKASDCIECAECEAVCPQHLEIRELLQKTAKAFER